MSMSACRRLCMLTFAGRTLRESARRSTMVCAPQVVRVMAAPQVFFETQRLLCGQQLQPAADSKVLLLAWQLADQLSPESNCLNKSSSSTVRAAQQTTTQMHMLNCSALRRAQGQQALGGAVAALGLSQKAVYADDEQPEAVGGDGAFNYSSGSDLAPNPAPSAGAGAGPHLLKGCPSVQQILGTLCTLNGNSMLMRIPLC